MEADKFSRKPLKLKPWHTNPANAWENQPPSSNDIFISSYREFLTTEFAQLHVTTLANDLERAQEYTYLRKLLMMTTVNLTLCNRMKNG